MGSRDIEKALFEVAVVIEDHETRKAFLNQACNGNAEQRTRLGILLEAHEASEAFFQEAEEARTVVAAEAYRELAPPANGAGEPAQPPLQAAEGPGSWIGRYKILDRIGEGGCGVVYLAEQQEPVQRLVALKVIRLGMDTESVIARFEAERQALAVMDHPNIAHVLDAGATETGRPYFVMEWVRGVRITDYCDEHRLDIRQRIDLFIKVCNAIQHAHQKGVIHRDIKPSNILVTLHNDKPEPKVIDFGIAKATSGRSIGETMLTAHEHFVGTPAYMSPEQADRKGLDVDTRSDVYGLGILLYELLTGRTPFDPKELSAVGVMEMRRMLAEVEVPSPSQKLAGLGKDELAAVANRRQTDPARLIPAIRGDLDWVVMKAIEKDRQRRYETVNGLAMDLRRFIENEAVMARPPSRVYLFGKFVRRNRIAVGASTGVAAALVLGIGLAYVSYLRERDAREQQERMRQVAEAARANEAKLRANASVRENIAQVAVMMSEGKIEEADAQLRHTPLSTIEPSLEAANVLRSLGGWNAMRGRWRQASECFLMLTQANHLSNPDQIIANNDLVSSGPALAANRDKESYARFREWVVQRFQDTTRPLAAQQVLQATLLHEADQEFLGRLQPIKSLLELAECEVKNLKPGWELEMVAWRQWSLALLEYRRSDFGQSLHWAEKARNLKISKQALPAALHSLLAMIHHQLGNTDSSLTELERARELIQLAFKPELAPTYEPAGGGQGYWWDWIQAQILFQEADALIHDRVE